MSESTINQKNIYGAWIAPNGDFIPVINEECHAEEAAKILGIIARNRATRKFTTYGIMFRLGYVRVIFSGANHLVNYYPRATKKRIYREWILTASTIDKQDRIY